ncbi:unnamed protein product [Lupinus luteus]|uniref:Aminotransferase-like plant mobile domain-containing protein n=1 Tax=Lupinus luteus TaxID=3873 RepID=A0AAV1VRQ1_LUPLU
MQFGMDQDIPGCVPRCNKTKAIAWENYCRPIYHRSLYFPSRLFEADVTTTYARWWKQSVLDHLDPVKSILQKKRSARRSSSCWTHTSKANRGSNDAGVPPGFPPKYVGNMISSKCCDDGSKRLNHCNHNIAATSHVVVRNLNHCSVLDDLEEDNKSLGNETAYEYQHLSNQCSSASTSDHGAVEKILQLSKLYEKDNNVEGSIGGLVEGFEDANRSERSRLSRDKACLSGTQDEDHNDSTETHIEEFERRINKLEVEFEQ